MSTIDICRTFYFHRPTKKKIIRIKQNRTTVYRESNHWSHMSISTYQMAQTFLFLFVIQPAARYNPIGTHTWHLRFFPTACPPLLERATRPSLIFLSPQPKCLREERKMCSFISRSRDVDENWRLSILSIVRSIQIGSEDISDFDECVSCEHTWNDTRPIYSPLSESSAFTKNHLSHSDALVYA